MVGQGDKLNAAHSRFSSKVSITNTLNWNGSLVSCIDW